MAVQTIGRAFPIAYGAGSSATGGSGGTVIHVTNLNDSGAGSFRAAFQTSGTRTIVFDVSGTIELTSSLSTAYGNVTIAGQTAPAGGITFTGNLGNSPLFEISGRDNMIFRYIRVRPQFYDGGNADVLQFNQCTNIIIDHCSLSWGGDECVDVLGVDADNITVQNCIYAESKTGGIMGNSGGAGSGSMANIGNLYFQVDHRHPNTVTNGRFDQINNVVWGYGYRLNRPDPSYPQLNEINNYYISDAARPVYEMNKIDWNGTEPQIYTKGNLHLPTTVTDPDLTNNNNTWSAFGVSDGAFGFTYDSVDYYDDDPAPAAFFTSTQHTLLGDAWPIVTASEAFAEAKTNKGANKYLNADGTYTTDWDAVDDYYLAHVNAGTLLTVAYPFTMSGKSHYTTFLSSVSSTPINSRSSYYGTNQHIPAAFLTARGVTNTTTVHNDLAPSGYTWMEEFLNQVDEVEEESGNISYELTENQKLSSKRVIKNKLIY